MKKFLLTALLAIVVMASASAQWWVPSGSAKGLYDQEKITDQLTKLIPVPLIHTGQERMMVAWRATRFDMDNKIGYVYIFCSGVGCIGYYTVYGKVASLNSFLVPEVGYVSMDSGYSEPLADIDGTYGHNIEGVFMRLTTGAYVELPTNGPIGYLYSDQPISMFANLTNFTLNSGGPATPKK